MSGGVKFIFKTLLKVPIFIFVTYFIFNLFAFTLSYFKVLGFSYVAMQTAVENNYIPNQEKIVLDDYLYNQMRSEILQNPVLIVNTDQGSNYVSSSTPPAERNARVQYGSKVTVYVGAHYVWIWPLMPHEQTSTGEVGYGLTGHDYNGGEIVNTGVVDNMADVTYNIHISYTVPGLKYYPDMRGTT